MMAAEDARVGSQRRDDVLDQASVIGRVPVLVRDVGVVTAREADPEHDLCHGGTVVAAVLTCHGLLPIIDRRTLRGAEG